MRSTCFSLLLLLLVVVVSPELFAQVAFYPPVPPYSNLTAKPKRDQKAEAVVNAAIQAMGGEAVIGQIQSWQIQGQFQRATKDGSVTGTLVWTKAGEEFRTDMTGPNGTSTMLTGHGKPSAIVGGATKALPAHVTRAMFIPALVGEVLLKELNDPNCSMVYGETTTLASAQAIVIHTLVRATQTEAMVTPQTWYFDATSNLPLRVEYRSPAMIEPRSYLKSAADFSDYRNISGAVYPFRIVRSLRGTQTDAITLQSVSTNSPIAASTFDAPAGGAK